MIKWRINKWVIILISLSFAHFVQGQTNETLNNTTVIKMVKAHLSDDLIIDEISNSKVNFNLSADSVAFLSGENVSQDVIEAMRSANGKQNPVVAETPVVTAPVPVPVPVPPPVSEPAPAPVSEPVKDDLAETASPRSVTSISYATPVKDLLLFYDNQIASLNGYIQKWDVQVRKALDDEENLMELMNASQKELTIKKNSAAKPFNDEVYSLKNKLAKYREEHELLKNKIRTDGSLLAEELKNLNKEHAGMIGDRFAEVIKSIKNVSADPSLGEFPEIISVPRPEIKDDLSVHIAPLIVIPACYQNEITSARDTIVVWTEKARAVIQRDAVLKSQLDPLNNQLAQYLAQSKENQKLNKLDITALKKQCDNLTKERRNLAKQMEKDSETLSANINKLKEELIFIINERFLDAIENVQFSYQDKF